ncbi:thiamine pyrophosphate-binding protein [Azospirillum sp. ST 5-10]|uniref:thiamine pyrophosphate-binding protein n=1 Tax=unclassified Azospirillum TaxID=2630922 RepID=UPI003F4A0791
MPAPAPRTGGRILVDALRTHGVDMAFCVPGESYLAVLDALHDAADAIRLIVCRQEGGAANMAEAYGKLTGRPGICFVTRGPGATNASIGVHTAFQDSTPMILFVGQVGRGMAEREAFQEIDYRRMFGPLTKWVAQIDDAARIPEMVGRAFHVAASGRPGPVVLALPEDMLSETAEVADARPYHVIQAHPGADDLDAMRRLLASAQRPLMIVGGGGWTAEASRDLLAFAEANGLPVAAEFRCQDFIDNTHPNYVGDVGIAINPALARRIRGADLILAVGARLGEMPTSGYTLLDIPCPRQTLVHVHAAAQELGRVYQADLPIHAGSPQFLAAARALEPVDSAAWRDHLAAARADYLANLEHARSDTAGRGGVDMGEVMAHLRSRLPPEAIITNGAGNYTVWVHRFYQHRRYRTQLAPASGAMGYGVPAAVAAKLVRPQAPVVCFAGDGCFLMTGQELATAVQYDAPVVFLVVNNGMFGTIRMHQERHYPGRISGTALVNPDFAAYARSFGAYGETVEDTGAFPAAFERALAAGVPALLELRVDPDVITPRTTLTAMRAAAGA